MGDNKDFFIVGMGASAGGLETFQKFFSNMPPDSGLAFVLVQHLHPHHESLMPELLSKSTDMPVLSATEGVKIEPNHVYVIPSNTSLTVENGNLHIEKPSESRGHRMPIDLFFKSLSEDCGERAICVVLSGTGSDGSLGIKAVKEHAGLAVAQNPDNAKYDSMPRNAIYTGLVDMVLDVHEMPESILNFLDKSKLLKKEMEEDDEIELHLDTIFGELEERTHHEFKGYKRNTILRRIRRRMQILQLDSLEHYAERVKEDSEEAQRLFKDLLIGVTHFFRDPASFEYLQERVIVPLLKKKQEDNDTSGIRIWVAGCATGEEAYTLALIIREEAAKIKLTAPVQIFATDIDENALAVARRAIYPEGIEEQVPEKHLHRFFSKQGSYYQVHKNIREMCIFSPHNLISDPPYSRIDLITCRNLLIYFDNSLQSKILPIFHYSLNQSGFLFLGPSENVSARPELFRANSKVHKIFQARENVPPALFELPVGRRSAKILGIDAKPISERKRESEKMLGKAFERKVLEQYVPFSAVVTENADILYWAGPRAKYLDPPRGIPRNNLLEIAHKSLRLNLRSGIHKVVTDGEEIRQRDVVVHTSGGLQRLDINFSPFTELGENNGLIFIVIREIGPPKPSIDGELTDKHLSGEAINQQLEEELRDTKTYLQSTIEELETSNEELKSSNEELLSMNEELQSSNEELQTSKEELQSVNEELETVNSELKNKVNELDAANSDLHNLYESTQIATLFLDNDMHIKAFTPAATELFRIIESDINRPIGDIVPRFEGADLVKEAKTVLEKLEKRYCNITHRESKRHYIMQMMPYRTVNNVIDGVSVSFVDITDIKKAKQDLEIRERILGIVTDSVPALIAYIDTDEKYRYCNILYQDWFNVKRDDIIGKHVHEVLGYEMYEELNQNMKKALSGKTMAFNKTLTLGRKGKKIISFRYVPHRTINNEICGFIVYARDESKRIARERKLGRLAAIVESTHEVIIGETNDGIITDWNIGATQLFGYSPDEAIGEKNTINVPEDKLEEHESAYQRIRDGKHVPPFETTRLTKDGKTKNIILGLDSIKSKKNENLGISVVALDITDRVNAEKKLADLNEELEERVEQRTQQLHSLTARFLSMEQRERRKFSQYLHDEIQQSLAAAKLLIEQVHNSFTDDTVNPALSESLRLLSEAIHKTRSITTDMSPPLMFDSGMTICLQWLARWAAAKLDIEVETTIVGEDRPVSEEIGYLLFRSMKELLFNIKKHAEVDKGYIEIRFDDDNLDVSITDKGVGFDPGIIEDLSVESYGLLSIVEQVRAMAGSVDFVSERKNGTRVRILVPRITGESMNNDDTLLEKKEDVLGKGVNELMEVEKDQGTIVLIVDDQKDLRYTLRLILEDLSSDYTFLEAQGGEEAIEVVKNFKPQVILMDISMNGMSGLEATKEILAINDEIRIIGLSMHENESMGKAMIDVGAAAYLTKDSSAEKILETIDQLCKADKVG